MGSYLDFVHFIKTGLTPSAIYNTLTEQNETNIKGYGSLLTSNWELLLINYPFKYCLTTCFPCFASLCSHSYSSLSNKKSLWDLTGIKITWENCLASCAFFSWVLNLGLKHCLKTAVIIQGKFWHACTCLTTNCNLGTHFSLMPYHTNPKEVSLLFFVRCLSPCHIPKLFSFFYRYIHITFFCSSRNHEFWLPLSKRSIKK